MHLETLRLDLLLPVFVVDLHVVQDCVHKHPDIWVLVRKQLQYDRHHLRLVQNHVASRSEEQELEEGVKDLLDHFVVLLLRAKQVLQELDEVGLRDG